ncbi:hypothetical protein SAMN05216412_106110 [Nitrosospira multiformis]|uniref:Uncharacterized protein n=1 Tax=Nitrosospira multiformis TaxID=1231 RepID=A0A1I0EC91_9PROT|nr:hypothetical protein SAMN05216412_106110 [Nitrosospira multiformis]
MVVFGLSALSLVCCLAGLKINTTKSIPSEFTG